MLRQCKGQKTQSEILANGSSPGFEAFLAHLGNTVVLQGFSEYRGGLDVRSGETGTHSVYVRRGAIEVMYHVGPLLPEGEGQEQQLGRKRHIGNDVVLLVYQARQIGPSPPSLHSPPVPGAAGGRL